MWKFVRAIDRSGERWLLLVFYTTIVMVVTTEVIRRFLLAYSSAWGPEMARYMFIYLAWVGAAAAVRDRAHIRIDAILHWLPPRGKCVLYLFGDVMTLVLAIVAVYWSMNPLLTSLHYGSVTQGLRISQAWFLAAVPFGFGLMIFRLVQSMWRDIGDLRAGRAPFEGMRLFE